MTLARTLFGIAVVVGSAAPAAAQYAPPRPAPQGPTRLVFPAPPWITNAPRNGTPSGPGVVTQPERAPEVTAPQPVSPVPRPMPPAPGVVTPVVPAIPTPPPAGITPAAGTAPRTTAGPRVAPPPKADIWRPGTTTTPGTVVQPKGR